MLALSAICGGFGGKVRYLVRRGWVKAANIYTVVAMESGERKSAVFSAVFAPVYAAEKAAVEAAGPAIAAAESERAILEARLKRMQGKAAKCEDAADQAALQEQAKDLAVQLKEFVVPPVPVFVVDDETLESLGKTLIEQDGRLLQAGAEGTPFEIAGGRYADDENFDVYLKSHDGDPLRIGRVGRGRSFHDSPALTCALAVQPDVLSSLGRSAKARGRGFLARWMYSVPVPRVGSRRIRPAPIPAAISNRYQETMVAIWGIPVPNNGPTIVPFGRDADDLLAKFETRLEPRLGPDGDLSGMASWGNKLAGEAARIAGALHMAEAASTGQLTAPAPISATAVESAVWLAEEYLIPHAFRAFGVMNADPAEALAQRAARWLARRPQMVEVRRNELYQGLKGGQSNLRADDLTPAVEMLVANGYLWLKPIPAGTRGMPSDVFEINPLWERTEFGQSSPESPERVPQTGQTPISGDSGDGFGDSHQRDEEGDL